MEGNLWKKQGLEWEGTAIEIRKIRKKTETGRNQGRNWERKRVLKKLKNNVYGIKRIDKDVIKH